MGFSSVSVSVRSVLGPGWPLSVVVGVFVFCVPKKLLGNRCHTTITVRKKKRRCESMGFRFPRSSCQYVRIVVRSASGEDHEKPNGKLTFGFGFSSVCRFGNMLSDHDLKLYNDIYKRCLLIIPYCRVMTVFGNYGH